MQGSERVYRVLGYIFAVSVITLGWQILSMILNNPAFPGVIKIIRYFYSNIGEVWMHAKVSFLRVICGIGFALLVALPMGLMSYSRKFDRLSSPFLYILYPIPHIVFLPLFLLLFGLGNTSKILLIAFVVFFQMWTTIRDAVKNIEDAYTYSLLSLGAGVLDVYRHLVIPYALPGMFTALRISIGTSIAILFFAESFATQRGLGFMIMDAWSSANYSALYAAMIAMSLEGLLLYIFVEILERCICRYRYVDNL